MGRKDEMVFLEDIIDCINKITEYVEDVTESEFEKILKNRMLSSEELKL